jgi:RNA polymerase sigma-70 factor, ECF subfamily
VEPTDADVIARSLASPSSFAIVFDRHAGVLFRFLVRRVGRDPGDELLGDVFRIAFERRATYDTSRPNARPWLYGIASNLVAKHRRSEGRRLRALARLDHDVVSDVAERVGDAVDADRRWSGVAERVGQLPVGERDALLLYAWEDLTYDEIAVVLDIPVGTVRSRLNRARRRLREPATPSGEQLLDHTVPALTDERTRIET